MDFWIDIGFAVLLRLLADRREAPKWTKAFNKLFNAIGLAFGWLAVPVEVTEPPKRG
jgi:hypothetical protein